MNKRFKDRHAFEQGGEKKEKKNKARETLHNNILIFNISQKRTK